MALVVCSVQNVPHHYTYPELIRLNPNLLPATGY
jgi:hypothetical protein